MKIGPANKGRLSVKLNELETQDARMFTSRELYSVSLIDTLAVVYGAQVFSKAYSSLTNTKLLFVSNEGRQKNSGAIKFETGVSTHR